MIKNKLWVFGDSFSSLYTNEPFGIEYNEYLGYKAKTFSEVIADKEELELINMARGGNDNYTILESICANVDKIKKDDYIIVGWSDYVRFRLVENGKWKPYNNAGMDYLLEKILVNRENKLVTDEVCNWTKMLKKLYGNKILFWSWCKKGYGCNDIILPIDHNRGIFKNSIDIQTKFKVNDSHLNEDGHKLLSELFISTMFIEKRVI